MSRNFIDILFSPKCSLRNILRLLNKTEMAISGLKPMKNRVNDIEVKEFS